MKKIGSILLLAILFGLAACSDDDKTEIPDDIIGKWKLQDMSIGTLDTSDSDVEYFAKEVYNELTREFRSGDTIEFRENGNGYFLGESVQFTIRKSIITMIDEDGDTLTLSYSLYNNRLTLTVDLREIILMDDDFDEDDINYLKRTLKTFTIDFILVPY